MMNLEGKKTYITAGVAALASFALAMGWLSQDQYQVVLGLLGSLGLAALRSGVAKGVPAKAAETDPEVAATGRGGANPPTACGLSGNG